MADTNEAKKKAQARKKTTKIPEENRAHREVYCRDCFAALLMMSPGRLAHRKADQCRGYRVGCTDRVKPVRGNKTCLECITRGRTCVKVEADCHALLIDLQDKYHAAFAKDVGSPEHDAWKAAAVACYDNEGNVLEGMRRLARRRADNTASAEEGVEDAS
ncbi:hypothetical protein B0T14DRAFT_494061 [Immersiella caudata]|uniref:Uncharacterized protein n=1 Tax=Immersiella caudata TaxID=314043 RepID=A0AA39WVI8_9PEZI|nr:hypothetical protein B0T14DRAFT_494061 [Immersiella caudata]